MKAYLLTVFMLLTASTAIAQTDNYRTELQNLADISRLPLYRTGDIEQTSSYDRTGGNDDGFSGKYSYIRKEAEGLVVVDLKGPGIINRIWTPTPSNDTIKFYFDGEKTARISMPFIQLFGSGKYPFVNPLCGNEVGGYFCYLPIPYEKSLKIVYKGDILKFHQIQHRSLPAGEKMKSFSFDMFEKNRDLIDRIAAVWNKKISPIDAYKSEIKTMKVNFELKSGAEQTLFDLPQGGRITGIELDANNDLTQAFRKIKFTAQWDNEAKKAFDLPLHDFFGFAFGKPCMQSLLLGVDNGKLYSYLPMPFDNSAKLALQYNKTSDKDASTIIVTGTIYYTLTKRNPATEGKLYTQSRRDYNPPKGQSYLIADVKGKGHFVGTILVAQGLEEGMTLYWEGDDRSIIDGKLKMHGTGTEDYFNGGWYAVPDRWDTGVSLPLHGAMLFDVKTGRTGGYRFMMSDKINFNSSYNLTMEHGPDNNNVAVDYSSVGFFYTDKPQFENTDMCIDNKVSKIARRDIMTAQGMFFTPYWFTQANFGENSIVFSSKRKDVWMTNIDFEAVPMVQIDLTGLDQGRYKLWVQHQKVANGKPFAIWQRTKVISDWIDTNYSSSEKTKTDYVGEIEVSDQVKTITIRKKKMDDTTVNLHQFIFEKIEKYN